MRGTWRLRLRMIVTSVLMFTIVYFLIMLVARYLGISSWRLYFGVSILIVFLLFKDRKPKDIKARQKQEKKLQAKTDHEL